jgi:hypothetical protein
MRSLTIDAARRAPRVAGRSMWFAALSRWRAEHSSWGLRYGVLATIWRSAGSLSTVAHLLGDQLRLRLACG